MSLLLGPTSSSQSAMTTSSEKSPLHKHFLFPDHFGEVSEMLIQSQTLIKVAHTKPILAIKQGMSCEGACAHGHVPCAVARVHVRAKSILKSVRNVRACSLFLCVRCAIPLLHTFSNKIARNCYFLF